MGLVDIEELHEDMVDDHEIKHTQVENCTKRKRGSKMIVTT